MTLTQVGQNMFSINLNIITVFRFPSNDPTGGSETSGTISIERHQLGIETEKGIQKVSRVIVCDTGPLIHLTEADAIHLLRLAGGILIPPAVATEFNRNPSNGQLPDWIGIHELTARSNAQVIKWVENDDVDMGKRKRLRWHCNNTAIGC